MFGPLKVHLNTKQKYNGDNISALYPTTDIFRILHVAKHTTSVICDACSFLKESVYFR